MPQKCTICTHKRRAEIDAAILDPAGSKRSIAARFKVSGSAVERHRVHIREKLAQVEEAWTAITRDSLLREIDGLKSEAGAFLEKAKKADSTREGLLAIREARSCLELMAKIQGDLKEGSTVNLYLSGEWHELRAAIFSALSPHPEAAAAVSAAILELRR